MMGCSIRRPMSTLDMDADPIHSFLQHLGRAADYLNQARLHHFPRVVHPQTLEIDAFSNRQVLPRYHFAAQEALLRDAFFIATLWQHLRQKILSRQQKMTDRLSKLNWRRAAWRFQHNHYPSQQRDLLGRHGYTSRSQPQWA